MRILWISHDPVRNGPAAGNSASGFWKEALLNLLKAETGFDFFVASPGSSRNKQNGNTYFFQYPDNKVFNDLPGVTRTDLEWIVSDCGADLIHVHGTELPYGLITNFIKKPVVVSAQGFLSACYEHLLGGIPLAEWKRKKTVKEYILRNSFPDMSKQWFTNSACEKKIIKANKYFIGRTAFDKKFISDINPGAVYFNGNELLRDDFYNAEWKLPGIIRHSIYTSSFSNPLKGFHTLLHAMPFLTEEFPDVQITVPGDFAPKMLNPVTGNSYYRMLREIMKKHNLQNRIIFKGKLSGEEITGLLVKSNVFVLSSFIENSSNALGEAQLLGVPSVTTNTGGTSSIINDKVNGLVFKEGDPYDLAQKIRQVFLSDALAVELSAAARVTAMKFHSSTEILNQYSTIYKNIISIENTL